MLRYCVNDYPFLLPFQYMYEKFVKIYLLMLYEIT